MTHVENLTFRFIDPLKPVQVYKVTKGDSYPRKMLGEILLEQMKSWDAPAPPAPPAPAPAPVAPPAPQAAAEASKP